MSESRKGNPSPGTASSPCSRFGDFRRLEDVPQPLLLRAEISDVPRRGDDLQRDPPGNAYAVRLEFLDLGGVVRHEPYGLDPEHAEHARGALVAAQVRRETEDAVCVDRVEAVVLKMVRCDLVCDADAPAFLGQVQEGTTRRATDLLQGRVELFTAIAALGSEHITRDAFGVQPHEDVLTSRDPSFDQGDMLLAREGTRKRMDPEGTVSRREVRRDREQDVLAKLSGISRHGRHSDGPALFKNSAGHRKSGGGQRRRCAAISAGAAPIAVAVSRTRPRPVRSKWYRASGYTSRSSSPRGPSPNTSRTDVPCFKRPARSRASAAFFGSGRFVVMTASPSCGGNPRFGKSKAWNRPSCARSRRYFPLSPMDVVPESHAAISAGVCRS